MRQFINGFISAFAVFSIFLGVIGRDQYTDSMYDHWHSSHYSIPVALFVLVSCFAEAYYHKYRHVNKGRKFTAPEEVE